MNKRYGDGIASRKEVQVNISRCFSLKRRARPLHYSGGVDRSSPSERKKKKAIRAAIERSCHSRSNFSALDQRVWPPAKPRLSLCDRPIPPSLPQFNFHRWFRLLVLPAGPPSRQRSSSFGQKGGEVYLSAIKRTVPASFEQDEARWEWFVEIRESRGGSSDFLLH